MSSERNRLSYVPAGPNTSQVIEQRFISFPYDKEAIR